LVRYKKLVAFNFTNDKEIVRLQKVLGQILFFPPNVAGWPGDRQWIDSTTLPLRLQLPAIMFQKREFVLQAKPSPEAQPEETTAVIKSKQYKVQSNWNTLIQAFSCDNTDAMTEALVAYLVQCEDSRIDKRAIRKYAGNITVDKHSTVIRAASYIMSLPEFQLI
ncbi:MAG: DUF1800 family protein, partial [Chitinophagales bacterium]